MRNINKSELEYEENFSLEEMKILRQRLRRWSFQKDFFRCVYCVYSFKLDGFTSPGIETRRFIIKIVFHTNARTIYNFLDFIKIRGKWRGLSFVHWKHNLTLKSSNGSKTPW